MARGFVVPVKLTRESLAQSAESVALADKDLARILEDHGNPPLWEREPGFETLVRIILEQQVSLVSADAMYRRLLEHVNPLTPQAVIAAGEPYLRSIGITRQKSGYFINLARAVDSGELDLDSLEMADDESVINTLTSIKGIGLWTANIYLLMALLRPDIWPVGDIALATAVKNLRGLAQRPTQVELSEMAGHWRPHRATAARLLWHYYLEAV
jgi:DNA-3-methyladenine glycosylase II